MAVVAATDGFWGVGKRRFGECGVEDLEEEYEDGDTNRGLELLVAGYRGL